MIKKRKTQNIKTPHVKNLKELLLNRKHEKQKSNKIRYSEYLYVFEEDLKKFYSNQNRSGFRLVHDPHSEEDFIPQKFMKNNLRADKYKIQFTYDELNQYTEKQRKKYIDNYAISHFTTEDGIKKMLNENYSKIKRRQGETEAENFIKRIGFSYVKVNYTEEDGLMDEINKEGHFNFLPYEGFNYKEHIDLNFGKRTIDYKNEEK